MGWYEIRHSADTLSAKARLSPSGTFPRSGWSMLCGLDAGGRGAMRVAVTGAGGNARLSGGASYGRA